MSIRIVAILSLCPLIGACHAHVQLAAPPAANAPLSERAESYRRLRPLTLSVSRNHVDDHATLSNDQHVYFPEDLLPVVAADSPTANWARLSQVYRWESNATLVASIAALIGGAVLSAAMTPKYPDGAHISQDGKIATVAGLALILSACGAALWVVIPLGGQADDTAVMAFQTYDKSLRQRLELPNDGPVPAQ